MNFPPRGQYLKGMWGRRIGWFGWGEGSLNGSTDQPFCQAKLRHHPAGRPPVALHPLPRPAVVCSWGDRQHLRWRSPDAKGNPPGARISNMHLLSWSRIDPVCRTNETKKNAKADPLIWPIVIVIRENLQNGRSVLSESMDLATMETNLCAYAKGGRAVVPPSPPLSLSLSPHR